MKVSVEKESYQVEGILFDKDGTIIDFYSIWGKWGQDITEDISNQLSESIHLNPEDMAKVIGLYLNENSWDPKGPLAISGTSELITILSHYLYQRNIPWNDAYTYVTKSFEAISANLDWSQYIKPIDGITEFIKDAHQAGLKMAVVTSDSTDEAKRHLDLLNLRSYFDFVIGHDHVERGKPFRDMADIACQQLGIENHQALMFGDSNGDMKLVHNAGLQAGIGLSAHEDHSHLEDANLVIQNYRGCNI
ncbi:HAD family hydrolase [Aquisalibacillus elongatus]|uniref:Phosphoglycolate phosphatase n=1 Tax=Aquisalibacillus elongatus TaxID=485577 RepID=A0A3N5B725_9BACI|nr:HAD-IA family hydrolase [Aquisalibacillus elongatus]RPF53496.1 phosphoglycolate phosphatase [Aquisalibacillus elongatus]